MIHIQSYLHREQFADVIRRWVHDQPQPTDGLLVTRLVHCNNAYVSRYLLAFAQRVLSGLHGPQLRPVRAWNKGSLKDALVARPPYRNARIEQLLKDYQEHPECQYRETPVLGTLFFAPRNGADAYVGSSRIKRVRRLAEKSARRISDDIFHVIKRKAEALADERARRLGIPRHLLVTPPEDMALEFARAESRIVEDLRQGRPLQSNSRLIVNDVAGMKVLAEERDYHRVLDELHAAGEVVEIETHRGNYNATNVVVRHRPDKEALLAAPPGELLVRMMAARGLDADAATEDFRRFVREGEDEVFIEVIVCSYQELLESEIGRCIHEDRILVQRSAEQYRGHLAKNVEYLVEYLMTLASSGAEVPRELPIKLWNRYLPDYFEEVIKGLHGVPSLSLAE